jgi:hypothetical protein
MNEEDLDRLLSPRALGGREREQVLERVLERVAPKANVPRTRPWGAFLVAASLAVVAGAAGILASRTHEVGSSTSLPDPSLRAGEGQLAARGSAEVGIHVEVMCADGSLSACPRGSHLLFAASSDTRRGYLIAYAEPVGGGGGGERVWYFSSERQAPEVGRSPQGPAANADVGRSPQGPAADDIGTRPVNHVVVIGSEHAVAVYAVHVLVSTHPLSRAEALKPDPAAILASEVVSLRVVSGEP